MAAYERLLRPLWTEEEINLLRTVYPKHRNEELVDVFGRTRQTISLKARRLGLTKEPTVRDKKFLPVGSRSRRKSGFTQIKIADTGDRKRDWEYEHVLAWKHANGDIPDGFVVAVIDGDKRNIAIENLALKSRVDLMLENTVHRLPPELKEVVNLKIALTHTINHKEKNNG